MDSVLPAIALRGVPFYPGMIHPLLIGRPASVSALMRHFETGEPLVLVPQVDIDDEDPLDARLNDIGVLARVLRSARTPSGDIHALLEGLDRVLVTKLELLDGATVAHALNVEVELGDPVELTGKASALRSLHQEFMTASGIPTEDHELLATSIDDPGRLIDQVAGTLTLSQEQHLAVLSEVFLPRRIELLTDHLVKELASQKVQSEVGSLVQASMDRSQREYHLREQLKAVKTELDALTGVASETERLAQRVRDAQMPEAIEQEALAEVERLDRLHSDSAEHTIARTWLETVCSVPWSVSTTDATGLTRAKQVLDKQHYGLEEAKERVLEFLAVRQLKSDSKGPILCFVGPPGVGKTSLGRSIAEAMGRNYERIAVGGIKDETEIRGHRRTYVGALPGRIIRALTRAGTNNPVIVLDELDKIGNDFRGDPSSALLEVLDPAQNHQFTDHYLDVPVDLSQVLFIGTANLADPIPPALYDRLEVIEVPGYTEEEKLAIARQHLLPRLAADHGLTGKHISFTHPALLEVVRSYTREAGVRGLERQLAKLHRRVAREVVEGKAKGTRITPTVVRKHLGPPRFFLEVAEEEEVPGVVVGLAWTAAGGDILFIEASKMPGTPALKLTGSLGPVMKESAEAAMTWLRSHGASLGIAPADFEASFHLHVPAGAIPKDGPSAGVTMITALASLITGRAVRPRLAMTGEITLRGKVLPVGGIKEKVLAARRAGISEIVLPRRNSHDLEDVPQEVLSELTVHYADKVEDVLGVALG